MNRQLCRSMWKYGNAPAAAILVVILTTILGNGGMVQSFVNVASLGRAPWKHTSVAIPEPTWNTRHRRIVAGSPVAIRWMPTLPKMDRHLQPQKKFQARYSGWFQVVQSVNCLVPDPVIRVMCFDAGTIQVEETVPSTGITCSEIRKDSSYRDYVDCTSIPQVYLNQNETFMDGAWGNIKFSCSGDLLASLKGYLLFTDTGNGTCTFDAASSEHEGSMAYVARLGIYCNDIGDFSYDDSFIECNDASLSWEGRSTPGNNFMCYDGERCESDCQVDFYGLAIWSDLAYIPQQCIQSLTGEDIPSYERQPPEPTEFIYSAKFLSEWSLNRDAFGITANCSGSSPLVNITCTNGQIRLVETIFPTVNCIQVGSSVLECTDSGLSFLGNSSGNFSGAIYDCVARNLPQTHAEYLPGEVSCNPNTLYGDAAVSYMLRIGVECDYQDYGIDFYYWDQYFECATENEFLYSEKKDNDYRLFTCSATAIFSQTSDVTTRMIGQVSIQTDTRWTDLEDDEEYTRHCHTKKPAPLETPSPLPSTPLPTTSLSPTATPSGSTEITDKGTPAAAVAGGVVGGMFVIVLLLVVSVMILKRDSRKRHVSSSSNNQGIEEPTYSNDHSDNPEMRQPISSSFQAARMGISSSPQSAHHFEYDFVHPSGAPATLEQRGNSRGSVYPIQDMGNVATIPIPAGTRTVRSASPQQVNDRTAVYPLGYKDQARTVMASTSSMMEHYGEEYYHMSANQPGFAPPTRLSSPSPIAIVKPASRGVVQAVPMADVVVDPVFIPVHEMEANPSSPNSVESTRRCKLDP